MKLNGDLWTKLCTLCEFVCLTRKTNSSFVSASASFVLPRV